MIKRYAIPAAGLALALMTGAAVAGEQEAIDGCINELRAVGGPDGQSGTVLSSEFSEAATLVMLEDAGGTVWRCLAYKDGTVGELTVASAADGGGGAMAGSGDQSSEVRVQFAAGTSGAELTGTLAPGEARSYVLGAKNGQFLYVRVAPQGAEMSYQILNPDGSFLLDMMGSDREYRGQLWQSGDHVIEVINRTGSPASYNVIFGIE